MRTAGGGEGVGATGWASMAKHTTVRAMVAAMVEWVKAAGDWYCVEGVLVCGL